MKERSFRIEDLEVLEAAPSAPVDVIVGDGVRLRSGGPPGEVVSLSGTTARVLWKTGDEFDVDTRCLRFVEQPS